MATAAVIAAAAGPVGASAALSYPGTEHFQVMTTSATSTKSSIIATGAFTAGGVIGDGFENGGTSTVVLPGGTFKITAKNVSVGTGFFLKTCLSTTQGNGRYKLHGGTGKYAKISGSGKFTISGATVEARNSKGNCTQKYVADQQMMTLRGPVQGWPKAG